jgi:hypothetical protein
VLKKRPILWEHWRSNFKNNYVNQDKSLSDLQTLIKRSFLLHFPHELLMIFLILIKNRMLQICQKVASLRNISNPTMTRLTNGQNGELGQNACKVLKSSPVWIGGFEWHLIRINHYSKRGKLILIQFLGRFPLFCQICITRHVQFIEFCPYHFTMIQLWPSEVPILPLFTDESSTYYMLFERQVEQNQRVKRCKSYINNSKSFYVLLCE